MIPHYRTIGEAWLRNCLLCLEQGRAYTIQRGSYAGQQRKQLDMLAFVIEQPGERPLGIEYRGQPVSSDAAIEAYYRDYLISPHKRKNEQYTYGERIEPYLERLCWMLIDTPHTNQATIEVARPEDIWLDDPPCLRVLSWKVVPCGWLQLSSFWRSWDLCSGFPTNLGGLQLLNEYIAGCTGLEAGPMGCYSDGAHLYDHSWGMFELAENNKMIRFGDIVKTKSEIGSGYWKIALPVTRRMIDAGVNVEKPGLYLFYGMWYGDNPLSTKSFGKVEAIPQEYELIGHISKVGCAEFEKHSG